MSDSASGHSGSPSSYKETTSSRKRGRNASRVGMACIPCRQSKLKCDGNKPSCQRCSIRSQDCFWAQLDGRSTEAKRDRRVSDVNEPSSNSIIGSSSSSERMIDQLELLANAAVEGRHPSIQNHLPSIQSPQQAGQSFHSPSHHQYHPYPSMYGGGNQHYHHHHHQQKNYHPSPSYYPTSTQSPPSLAITNQVPYYNRPIRSISNQSTSLLRDGRPNIKTSSQGGSPSVTGEDFTKMITNENKNNSNSTQQSIVDPPSLQLPMWWERRGVQNGLRRGTGLSPGMMINDPLAGLDWASLGLEPEHLTDDMVDMLTGKVVWVDPPSSMINLDSSDPISSMTEDGGNGVEEILKTNEQQESNLRDVSTGLKKEEKSSSSEVVRIQYFRLLGPTGISPGIKKISMELKLTPSVRRALFDSTSPSTSRPGAQRVDWEKLIANASGASSGAEEIDEVDGISSSEEDAGIVAHGLPNRPDLFDGDVPAAWVLQELLPIFFDRLGDHYLCLNRKGLEERLGFSNGESVSNRNNSKSVPPMLINVICALAARFSKHPHIVSGRSLKRAHTFGKRFARKAKDFLATSLTVPGRTTILAFLMMAWHEFACNLDSAFWNYGGMALRMAIDLGLQRHLPTARDTRDMADADLIDDTLLFWAVYQMDRILVVGTGRPTSIKDREITCPMPIITNSPDNESLIFAYYIRLVRIGGKIAETINAVLVPDDKIREEIQRELDFLENELIEQYESIPSHLRLNTSNFKLTRQKHLFLEFHLWFHNLLFILNRSPIVEMRKSLSGKDAVKVVRKSVQRCADVVALDDAYDNQILESVPMANQTLFLAGCAELEESRQHIIEHDEDDNSNGQPQNKIARTNSNGIKNGNGGVSRSSNHLMREAEDGYKKFASALERISIYWDGVRWIHGVLTQRQLGMSHTDLVELAVGTDALVSKRELRLLQRLSTGGDNGGGGGGIGEEEQQNNLGIPRSGSVTSNTRSPSRAPLEFSDVGSLDELASLLPQVQSILAAQYPQNTK